MGLKSEPVVPLMSLALSPIYRKGQPLPLCCLVGTPKGPPRQEEDESCPLRRWGSREIDQRGKERGESVMKFPRAVRMSASPGTVIPVAGVANRVNSCPCIQFGKLSQRRTRSTSAAGCPTNSLFWSCGGSSEL